MRKTHHRRTYFQASALKLMSVQGGSAVTLPAPADKLAPKDVFLCLCSQAQPGILLCWGHTSKGVCPFQDFDTDFFIQPLNCKAEKKSISQSPCPCFCTAISAIPICIPIFQKGSPSSAIRQLLIEPNPSGLDSMWIRPHRSLLAILCSWLLLQETVSLSHCDLWSSVLGFYLSLSWPAGCCWALHPWWSQTSSNFLPECIWRQFMSWVFLG